MKNWIMLPFTVTLALVVGKAGAGDISLESAPPVVTKTVPQAGSVGVDPGLTELQVTFSKTMQDGSWSWTTWGEGTFPETTGNPRYLADGKTCALPVKLQPGKFYATWLNSQKFLGFQDTNHQPAAPYLLTFETARAGPSAENPGVAPLLNADQRVVLQWTESGFQELLDSRSFEGWSPEQRATLEAQLLEALKGEPDEHYYRAIGTLGALRTAGAATPLLTIASDPREKDNRDRWLAVRSLGLLGDKRVVPELIHLLYHYNANTRWWAQISLVRLTGTNFGKDWKAWGKWWNAQGGQPAWKSQPRRWIDDPDWADSAKLEASVTQADLDFLGSINPRGDLRSPTAPGAELSKEQIQNPKQK